MSLAAVGLSLAALLLPVGCALPDLAPLADATTAVHRQVVATGAALVTDLERVAALDRENPTFASAPGRFGASWQAREEALAGLVRYCDALAGIVEAADLFTENATSLADSVNGLLSVVGQAQLGEVVTGAAVQVGQLVATLKATKDIERAVETVAPYLQGVADILETDLKQLQEEFLLPGGVLDEFEATIKEGYTRRFGADAGYRARLVDQHADFAGQWGIQTSRVAELRQAILVHELALLDDRTTRGTLEAVVAREAAGEALDDVDQALFARREELPAIEARIAATQASFVVAQGRLTSAAERAATLESAVDEVDGWLAATDVWHVPLRAELDVLEARRASVGAMIETSRRAIAEWARVHADLAAALSERRRPNVRLLVTTVQELEALRARAEANDG